MFGHTVGHLDTIDEGRRRLVFTETIYRKLIANKGFAVHLDVMYWFGVLASLPTMIPGIMSDLIVSIVWKYGWESIKYEIDSFDGSLKVNLLKQNAATLKMVQIW